jgi:predicted transcriptional regulator
MDKVMDGIPGTFPCADDVKVQGSTKERHDMNLLETVQKATEAGIKFNPEKCKIKQQKIEYFGRIVSPKGVIPCHKKVKAIMEMPAPTNKQELQSFLGTINFLATHIPNLSNTHT